MTAGPVIRPMLLEDLDRLMPIEQQVFSSPWARNSYEYEISSNRYSMPLVMELADQLIGYAVIWSVFEEFHIATFAIAPGYQRKGYGTHLMNHIIGLVEPHQYVLLEVRRGNIAAMSLYERFGFHKAGIRPRYYQDGEDAILMRLDNPR